MKITEKLRSIVPHKAQEQSTPAGSSTTPAHQPKAHKNSIKDRFSKHSTSKPAAARSTETTPEPSTSLLMPKFSTVPDLSDLDSSRRHRFRYIGEKLFGR